MSHRYTSINIVSKQHLDGLNHVNNVQYLYWAQEVAKAHWNLIQELLDQTLGVWMVRSHEVNYKRGAFLGESIRMETYVKEVRGPLSIRVVDFFNDKTNQLLVRSQTQWCYVDLSSRKPIKIPTEIATLFLSKSPPF